MPARLAYVRRTLKSYAAPDTTSAPMGTIAPGRYPADEERTVAGNDFVRLSNAWICSRSGEVYADVFDVPAALPQRPDFSADGVDESKLVELFKDFDGFVYGAGQYPRELPNINIKTDLKQIDCCCFAEALVVKAFIAKTAASWSSDLHKLMMIQELGGVVDWYGPVTAVVKTGLAVAAATPEAPPQPWTLMQGWRIFQKKGHTFLIVEHDPISDRVLVLESNKEDDYQLDGPGFRNFGALSDFRPNAPAQWYLRGDCPTWAGLRKAYEHRQHATLRVKGNSIGVLPPY